MLGPATKNPKQTDFLQPLRGRCDLSQHSAKSACVCGQIKMIQNDAMLPAWSHYFTNTDVDAAMLPAIDELLKW